MEPGLPMIQRLCRLYRVSARKLAREVNLAPSTMAEIVFRGRVPSGDTAILISRYFRKLGRINDDLGEYSVEAIWGESIK